jgi:flagellar motor switch protein FliM
MAEAETTETESTSPTISQEEVDELIGVKSSSDNDPNKNRGIKAMLDKALQSYERLPMLDIVFDRFVRVLSTSLRNFTSESVDIDIKAINFLRFGNYINTLQMPSIVTIFKALEWENFGLIIADGGLVFSLVDTLFGGRKNSFQTKVESRPYTTIEQNVVKKLSELILSDLGASFDPLSPATFQFERIETNPKFATIARPGEAAILLQLSIQMEARNGKIDILFPYATLEPIRDLLLQVFMGEKFGKDTEWETDLQNELLTTPVKIKAILNKKPAVLHDIMSLKVGSTILMNNSPEDDVVIYSDQVKLYSGKLGRVGNKIAVNINNVLNKKLKENK